METTRKPAWLARCALRLAELQPTLSPVAACRIAALLWQDERGHIPPEEWAEIEVNSWATARAVPTQASAAVRAAAAGGAAAGAVSEAAVPRPSS